MAPTEEQKIAAAEWLREHPKIQKQLRGITYDLIYKPFLKFCAVWLGGPAAGYVWILLWSNTLRAAPFWWQAMFILTLALSITAFALAIREPAYRVRSTIVGAILLSIPYLAELTAHVLS